MPTPPFPSRTPAKEELRLTGAPSAEASNTEQAPLEKDVPVSDSLIWRVQRESYMQRGMKSWTEDRVPQFITNNPFIAEMYARIAFGFLCDCLEPAAKAPWKPSAESPLRILELGAGPGKFSFLFLRHLETLLKSREIPLNSVRYCMTDCSESLVESWRANPFLADLCSRGILAFAPLDAGKIDSRFLGDKTAHSLGPATSPLVVIANYVFDSLPHDAFVVEDGQLFEFLQTTTATAGEGLVPEALTKLHFSYDRAEVSANRYPKSSLNSILESYRERPSGTTILFPTQVLQTLDEVSHLTAGPMLVLAADKGYVHEQDLSLASGSPKFEFHADNCFSQMVNFDALAKYFKASGGEAFLPDKHSASLNICAFLQRRSERQFPALRSNYQDAIATVGPDDLFALLAWLNPHMEEMSVPQILALLRITRWDPTAFLRIYPVLARQVRNASAEGFDLRDAVLRSWANHFPITQSENILAFYCGAILLELQFFDDAAAMFKNSEKWQGPSAATSYNLGLCSAGLGHRAEALALMIKACEQDPRFEPAQIARETLERGA